MTEDRLLKEYIKPAYKDLFEQSESFLIPQGRKLSFKEICSYSPIIKHMIIIPFEAFYINDELFTEIANRNIKKLRGRWIYPFKLSPKPKTKEELEEMRKDIENYPDDEVYDMSFLRSHSWLLFPQHEQELEDAKLKYKKKEITRTKYENEVKRIRKRYHLKYKSFDKQMVLNSIYLGSTPLTSYEAYKRRMDEFLQKDKPIKGGWGKVFRYFEKDYQLSAMHYFKENLEKGSKMKIKGLSELLFIN